jgi:uncharacterized repeat protein (TIGR01451 family)
VNNEIGVRLVAARIVAPNVEGGRETRASAESAKPGDVIEYRADYRNAGKSTVRAVQATLPIPPGTELLAGSATPGTGLRASLDGKAYQALPLMRRVKRADGQSVEVPVPLAEYRFLRWDLGDLAAQRETSVSARVRVSTGDIVATRQ